MTTVLIPAHNEEATLGHTLASLMDQTSFPTRVLVVCDNCTDDTAKVARYWGADSMETHENSGMKAGALNQALGAVLRDSAPADTLLVMDADSTISADFIETAERTLAERDTLGAVGGVFYGDAPRSLLQHYQANEYHRYGRTLAQTRGRVRVLTGTASMFRTEALKDLIDSRGYAYDEQAITEDNEITLALKTRGWELVSPHECRVSTDLMTTWRELGRQRLRWYHGALQNLTTYGWTKVTRRYWLQQAGLMFSTVALALYLLLMALTVTTQHLRFDPWWALVGAGFVAERLVTVWARGWRARAISLAIVPEMIYDVVLQAVFVAACMRMIFRVTPTWNRATESAG